MAGYCNGTITVNIPTQLSACVQQYAGNDGVIQKSEAIQAVLDYFDGKIDKPCAVEVVLAYYDSSGQTDVPLPQDNSVCTGLIGRVTQQEGNINIVDALFIAQATVGTRTLTDCQLRLADVNGDGVVNITDALLILQYTVGTLNNAAAIARINKPIPTSDLLKSVPILNGAPSTVDANNPNTWNI